MVRVDYWCPRRAIVYVHGDAWRAGFGSLSRLFDLSTFGGMRRRSLRQLVGECLMLSGWRFLHRALCCFGHGRALSRDHGWGAQAPPPLRRLFAMKHCHLLVSNHACTRPGLAKMMP